MPWILVLKPYVLGLWMGWRTKALFLYLQWASRLSGAGSTRGAGVACDSDAGQPLGNTSVSLAVCR
jgi:hypothetical protein